MKKINYYCLFYIFIFSYSNFYFGQNKIPEERYSKLFQLDELSSKYQIKKYTLTTRNLYEINKSIDLYNVFVNNNGILLITVLPELREGGDWKKVNYNLVKDKIMTESETNNFIDKMYNNTPEMKTMKYGLLKKVNNEYYISGHCLIEYFSIMAYEYPLITRYGTINIKEKQISINDMLKFYKEKMPKDRFPLDIRPNPYPYQAANPFIQRNYLSEKYKIQNTNAYQFWTLDVWNTIDGYNERRGIDRFVYIPEKGIVGGSYDFYFEFNAGKGPIVSYDKLWDNIINEKVMIAEELK
ncbi:hypothetical protein [Elizabethkingia anophelis]|uniref:hypothetical protein n=1 Tax=Elizabethkingia anophelis TaxID=1117645 RepID=UPI0037317A7B|nr:hypothetical protein [Elizabethkingia anophelis]